MLFLLYISDFEDFFRARDLKGADIDGRDDLLALLCVDDAVILAHSHIDLLRKLRTLADYCDANDLTVNVNKIKIVIFKSKGRAIENRFIIRRIKANQSKPFDHIIIWELK